MRQKSNSTPASSETLVRNIRRATRKELGGKAARSKRVLKTSLMTHQRTCELAVSSRKRPQKDLGLLYGVAAS